MKRLLGLLALLVALSCVGLAQFEVGKNFAGPAIGLSFLGSTPQFGLNYEYGMKMEFGTVGVGGLFRYWSYSEDYLIGKWKYTDVLFGAQGNYHFKLENTKIDPWAGLVLAYDAGSVSWDGPFGGYAEPTHGGLFLGAHGGARYFFSPTMAVSARFGVGTLSYSSIDIGLDWKF
ncbi:MAG: hypothetical protein FJ217_08125 [Ignavibacteria bacterium]|nr:hypothetical protein [Ignavibacteria bacterium]